MGSLKNIARITITVVLIISTFFIFQASKVGFDYNFEDFFAKGDPETEFFETHRRRFETDNDFIFIALKNDPSVFDTEFLKRVRGFVNEISQDSLVENVQCLTHMDDYVKNPNSPLVFDRPYLDIDDPSKMKTDSARIFKRPELVGYMITEDASAILVYIKHLEFLAKEKCDVLKVSVDNALAKYEFKDYVYAGRTIGLGFYVDTMISETIMFIAMSFGLVMIFLVFSFKSFWGLWLPMSIVGMSMMWILGLMGTLNEPISLILTVLPSIIFVVAMSDVIHLVSKYLDELRSGLSKEQAIRKAYKEVGLATLLTSITTAIGFLTLLMVDMEPVRKFGIFIAAGVMMAFILAYTMLPSMLVLTKTPKIKDKELTQNIWYKALRWGFMGLIRKRKIFLFVTFGIIVFGAVGSTMVEQNYFLLEDLKEDSDLRKDYDYFDNELMGLRPFELAIEVKDPAHSVLDYEVLSEMNKIEDYLLSEYGLRHTFSIISLLKISNRTENSGKSEFYQFPNEENAEKYIQQFEKYDKTNRLGAFVDSTKKHARIASTSGDWGLKLVREKNQAFDQFVKEEINTDLIDVRYTGTAHLLDRNMDKLSKNLVYGLLLAVAIVSLIMGFLFKSIKMVLIAIIPNIIPLLLLGALLGLTGIKLQVSTAIVFTISFGIAVDDTIHFMSKLRIELSKGRQFVYALKRTYLATGRAITLTSIILVSGFLLLMFSDFLGTFYIGLLISATLVFALIADLVVLPILLIYFYHSKADKQSISSSIKEKSENHLGDH